MQLVPSQICDGKGFQYWIQKPYILDKVLSPDGCIMHSFSFCRIEFPLFNKLWEGLCIIPAAVCFLELDSYRGLPETTCFIGSCSSCLGFASDSMGGCLRSCTFKKQYHIGFPDPEERLKERREKEFHDHENGDAALFIKERFGKQIHDVRQEEENEEDVETIYRENSAFPPPLPSLSALSLKSHKQNGRFVLQCRKRPQKLLYYVQTYREDGRLKGNLVVVRDGFEL